MRSRMGRKLLRVFVGVLISAVASSCLFQIKEQPKSDGPLEFVDPKDQACLEKGPQILEAYFGGELADVKEVDDLFQCASKSLELFYTYTKGAKEGVFSPDELRKFLQRYFLGNIRITDRLLKEAMILKQTILGGPDDVVTLDELKHTRDLFDIFRIHLIRMYPYMPMSPERMKKVSDETLNSAIEELQSTALALGGSIQQAGFPYSFEHFERFLVEISGIYKGAGLKALLDRMQLIRALKAITVAPPDSEIQANEWSTLFKVSVDWFSVFLRYVHLSAREDLSFSFGKGHQTAMEIFGKGRQLMSEAIARQPGDVVTIEQLAKVVKSLKPEDLAVRQGVLVAFLDPLVHKLLAGATQGSQGRQAAGITQGAVERLREVVERWSDGQTYLEELYGRVSVAESGQMDKPLDALEFPANVLLKYRRTPNITVGCSHSHMLPASGSDIHEELDCLIGSTRPLFKPKDDMIFFPNRANQINMSFFNLSRLNWVRQLIRYLMAGYIDPNSSQGNVGVTVDQLHDLVTDILGILLDLKAIDSRVQTTVHQRRFREGSLFLFASNGDSLLDIDEAGQLLSFMISTKYMADRMHDKMFQDCGCIPDPVVKKCLMDPYFDHLLVDLTCYKTRFFQEIPLLLDHLPMFQSYYTKISTDPARVRFLQDTLIQAARTANYGTDPMDIGDSDTIAGMLQYVEAIFARFDLDESGDFNRTEAERAFEIFKAELAKIKPGQSDDTYMGIFAYLLDNGAPPNPQGVWQQIGFLFDWVWNKKKEISSPREKIFDVFAQLGGTSLQISRKDKKESSVPPPEPKKYLRSGRQ